MNMIFWVIDWHSSSAEEAWVSLTRKEGHIDVADVTVVYDKLKPVSLETMLGEWTGGDFDYGHPARQVSLDLRWAGKVFRSENEVDPIIVYDDSGERVWNKDYGHAVVGLLFLNIVLFIACHLTWPQLREVKYRGVISTAMIYDNFPIIDHFRYVNDDMVAGAMDTKMYGDVGMYYFHLTRMK
jgi:hypothetical protein